MIKESTHTTLFSKIAQKTREGSGFESSHKVPWQYQDDHFYAVIPSMGLVKFCYDQTRVIPGEVVQINEAVDNLAFQSMMILNDKIYIRHEDMEKSCLSIFDMNTLEEIKRESEEKIEPKEGSDKSILWKSEDEETGRSMTFSPMTTDGTYVYLISRRCQPKNAKETVENEDENQPTKLYVEVFDPSKNFEFVREVLLLKKAHGEPWVKDENSQDLLKKLAIFTNGTHLCVVYNAKIIFFNLTSGKQDAKLHCEQDGVIMFDSKDNQMVQVVLGDEVEVSIFNVTKFKPAEKESSKD